MDARILTLNAQRRVLNSAQTEVHLSTLNGLHVIPAVQCDGCNGYEGETLVGALQEPGAT